MSVASVEVLKKIDMAQLLTDIGFTEVDGTKTQYLGYCVFHNDVNTKSFSCNIRLKLFHCFGCNLKGDAIKLYALWKGIDYAKALYELEQSPIIRSVKTLDQTLESYNQSQIPSYRIIKILTDFINKCPSVTTNPEAKKYLNSRSISDAVLDYVGVKCYVPEAIDRTVSEIELRAVGLTGTGDYERFTSNPILFPYRMGNVVGTVQGRCIGNPASEEDPKYVFTKGPAPFAFNHDALRSDAAVDSVFICEGVTDVLSLLQLGFPATIGVPGVHSFKMSWLSEIRAKKVIVAFDNDRAGEQGFQHISKLMATKRIPVEKFQIPIEFKDVNQYLQSLASVK